MGSFLSEMAVSPDGRTLYALDFQRKQIAVVDLDTRTVRAPWLVDGFPTGDNKLLAIRPNGVDVALAGDGRAFTAGRSLGNVDITDLMSATDDGSRVYTTTTKARSFLGGYSLKPGSAEYLSLDQLVMTPDGFVAVGLGCDGLAFVPIGH